MPTEPGLTSSTPPAPRARERQVGVAEDHPRRVDAVEQLGLVVGRLGQERAHVAERRAVADQRVAVARQENGSEARSATSSSPSASRAAAIAPGTTGLSGAASGSAVQRSPLPRIQRRALELAQPRDGLGRPAAEQRVVAAEHPARRRPAASRVGEHRLERRQVAVHVVEQREHAAVYSIGPVSAALPPHEADPLVVTGPTLSLRYARAEDAPRLFELASDPAVTRFFSWGPVHERSTSPRPTSRRWPAKRERGELLDFLIVHHERRADRRHRPVGALAPATATPPSARGSGTAGGAAARTSSPRR